MYIRRNGGQGKYIPVRLVDSIFSFSNNYISQVSKALKKNLSFIGGVFLLSFLSQISLALMQWSTLRRNSEKWLWCFKLKILGVSSSLPSSLSLSLSMYLSLSLYLSLPLSLPLSLSGKWSGF